MRIGYSNINAFLLYVFIAGMFAFQSNASDYYVVEPGTIESAKSGVPYNTWTNAATNLFDIVGYVHTSTINPTVWVSNGVYYLTNKLDFTDGTLRSVNGRNSTVIDGSGPDLSNTYIYVHELTIGATIRGFTIRNFWPTNANVGAISANYRALITECLIISNRSQNDLSAGGVYLAHNAYLADSMVVNNIASAYAGVYAYPGSISNCVINSNYAFGSASGYAIYARGSTIDKCVVGWNTATGAMEGAGGVYMEIGGTIRNSLICSNYHFNRCGGINANTWITIQNCTIVNNQAHDWGAGAALRVSSGCLVQNCVIWSNISDGGEYIGGDATVTNQNNCSPATLTTGTNNSGNTTNHPLFIDWASGNYRFNRSSPCVNTGTNQDWMTFDLDGHHRIDVFSGIVDMGCYEYVPAGLMFKSY